MPYQTTKPAPTDDLDVSVTDIQQNFLIANTVMDINHYPFNDVTANKGKHKFVEMPLLVAVPTIAASSGGLYTKAATSEGAGTETDLFYTPDASGNEYQLTRTVTGKLPEFAGFVNNYDPGSGAVGTDYTAGWTFLPGGLLFQYGFYDTDVVGLAKTGTIKFPVVFSSAAFVVVPQLTVSAINPGNHTLAVIDTTLTTADFQWRMDDNSTKYNGIYWYAIGK